jgi:hypothetical protein
MPARRVGKTNACGCRRRSRPLAYHFAGDEAALISVETERADELLGKTLGHFFGKI